MSHHFPDSSRCRACWPSRNPDSGTRATVLSTNGHLNALGQVAGGPPLGALANASGIPVALVASAAIQFPTAARFVRVRSQAGTRSATAPEAA